MAKAKKMVIENLRLVSVVVELVDARAPLSTRNPDIDSICVAKPRVVVLNKSDLADPSLTKKWLAWYERAGVKAVALDSTKSGSMKPVIALVKSAVSAKAEAMAQKGAKMTVRAMVLGIPNVGKSTFINLLKGRASAKAGDKPGVTRAKQWVAVSDYLEFLDTPGLLWPKLDDKRAAALLAYLGSVRGDIMDMQELAASFLSDIASIAPKAAAERYKLSDLAADGHALLEQACMGRGWLLSGGRFDTERAASIVLDEFRSGKLGKITLEEPPSP